MQQPIDDKPQDNSPNSLVVNLSPSTHIWLHLIDRTFTTLWLLIKCGFWLGIAYIGFLCIRELSGHTTVANFVLGYFTSDTKDNCVIWVFVAVFCFVWALIERKLRFYKVASMSNRIKLLETKFDAKRSSSGLTESGETPLEEELP